jgi:hypothetical protein
LILRDFLFFAPAACAKLRRSLMIPTNLSA